jgi:hypothetical protein
MEKDGDQKNIYAHPGAKKEREPRRKREKIQAAEHYL